VSRPPFARVAIYGLGLIGGSIALALKRRWPAVHVAAIDRAPVVEIARGMRIADVAGDSLDLATGSDLVVLAAPVSQNIAALEALPQHLPHPVVVTDVGSTKRAIAATAAALPSRITFVGGHPLAGAAVSGVEAARPDLFTDRPWILTGADAVPTPARDAIEQFVVGMGAIPQQMDAADHDRLLAYISHLPQLAVSALMHVVGSHTREDGLVLAGRGLRDTTRLASSPAPTWRDIVGTNEDNIAQALDDFIAALEQLRPGPGADHAALSEIFLSAAKWKGVLDHS
jgi:prephenate dehydrogenase